MRLPDDVLARDPRQYSSRRGRNFAGRAFLATSAWTTRDEARAAAAEIRHAGGMARATSELRPLWSYNPPVLRGERRKRRSELRYIWIVWSCAPSEPAHAENNREEARA